MIVFLPVVLFTAAGIVAYLRGARLRLYATVVMLAATAWSLLVTADWQPAAGWLIGPVLGTLLVSRPRARRRLSFEEITRRATTLAATGLVALFAASKFPIGENPTLLSAVPWLLGAVGAAWLISPIDEKERAQADVLLIAAGSALLLMATPGGLLTAAACGAMALIPPLAARWPLTDRLDAGVRSLLIAAATAVAALALLAGSLPRPALQDLALSLQGPTLVGVALLLVAGAALGLPGRAWVVVPALLAPLAIAPSLRWAALAALIAITMSGQRRRERFAWIALFVLGLSSLFALLVSQPWSPRAQIVALAGSLLLMAVAATGSRFNAVALAGFALVILQDTSASSAFLMTRFGWVASAGAILLALRALLDRRAGKAGNPLQDALICGLLLLAVAAHDSLGLGVLAAVLLLVDLVISGAVPDPLPPRSVGLTVVTSLLLLSRSGWPPTVRFAAVTLALIAALQTSLAAGLLAALLSLGLKFSPLLKPAAAGADGRVPAARFRLLGPALSLACGLGPALVLRMLRV